MERMSKPKFIKEIEKSEGKERAKCGRWYIRVYGELDHKPMVELESLEIIVKELHKLEEENKKLNIKVASLEGGIKGLNYTIEKLKEENQTLELWLDNKEKVNKSLREENKNLKEDNKRLREGVDAGQKLVEDLISKNRNLKEELSKYKKTHPRFSDFGGYDLD